MVCQIPDGAAGTRETLKIMARMAKDAARTPAIREIAMGIVNDLAAGNYHAEADALHR